MGRISINPRALLAALLVLVVGTLSVASQAEARGHLPRWKTRNGYVCVKHTKRIRVTRHRGHVMWPHAGHKARIVCMKQRTHVRRHRPHSSVWVLPGRVVMCESGGNPRAVNYTNPLRPAGLYQIITPTWVGYGGGRYASTADRASVWAQGVIAKRVLASQGPRAWACW